MNLSSFFNNCHAFRAVQSIKEQLPDKQSAVYAFYDFLSFDTNDLVSDVDKFKTCHGRQLRLDQNSWPFSLSINFRGNPDRFKGEGKKLAQNLNEQNIKNVTQHLNFLSFLNEPLYIGKTENVKSRFISHHDTGFLFKMKRDFKRPPDEFLFFAYFCPKEMVRLVESILIQIINPPFCEQKS